MKQTFLCLKQCSLFSGIDFDDIETYFSSINYNIKKYNANDVCVSTIDISDRLGIIIEGLVDIEKCFPNGKMILIERKRPSQIIGEASIFSQYETYTKSAIASKKSTILYITKVNLMRLFEKNNKIMLNYLEYISNSALFLEYKIGLLSLKSIKGKISGYLLHSLQYEKNLIVSNNILKLPFSKKEWAEFMDVSRTSLSRELKVLELDGILSFEKRFIVINDINRLKEIIYQ